jgi:hypothetical protein
LLSTYKDINELPVVNWFKVHKDASYELLLRDKVEMNGEIEDELFLLWDVLNNQYIERFGLSPEYEAELDIRDQIAIYQADRIINNDNYFNTLIAVEKQKLKSLIGESGKAQGYEKTLMRMSRVIGFKLDSRDMTTEQYYSYLHELTDGKEVSE